MKNFIRRMYTTEILMLNDAATGNVFWFYKGFCGAEWSSKKKKNMQKCYCVPQPLESQIDL